MTLRKSAYIPVALARLDGDERSNVGHIVAVMDELFGC